MPDIMKKAQKIVRRGHHKLFAYAIGMEYSKQQWRHLAHQLLHRGFMTQDMEYGGLHLTPNAWEFFWVRYNATCFKTLSKYG